MPNRPPNRGFNCYDDSNVGGPSLDQNMQRAAQLGGNCFRLVLSWQEFQPNSPAEFNPAPINAMKARIDGARLHRPGAKALVLFAGPLPAWVRQMFPDQCNPESGTENVRADPNTGATDALGYFGVAAAQALVQLAQGSYADVIEIYNEPNAKGGGEAGSTTPPVPIADYGDMCAFAAYWVWNCVSHGACRTNPLLSGLLRPG